MKNQGWGDTLYISMGSKGWGGGRIRKTVEEVWKEKKIKGLICLRDLRIKKQRGEVSSLK